MSNRRHNKGPRLIRDADRVRLGRHLAGLRRAEQAVVTHLARMQGKADAAFAAAREGRGGRYAANDARYFPSTLARAPRRRARLAAEAEALRTKILSHSAPERDRHERKLARIRADIARVEARLAQP